MRLDCSIELFPHRSHRTVLAKFIFGFLAFGCLTRCMNREFFSTALILVLASATIFAAQPALTIYNQNFAVVRDTIPLDLKAGVNDIRFTETTAHLEPDSVILRDPAGKTKLQ